LALMIRNISANASKQSSDLLQENIKRQKRIKVIIKKQICDKQK